MKINALANKLEFLEDKYYLGDKTQKLIAKAKYKNIVKEYSALIKMMKKSETKEILGKLLKKSFFIMSVIAIHELIFTMQV